MSVLAVYLRLYGECLRQAFVAIGKSPWTLLLPGAILLVREAIGRLAFSLGMLGGIVLTLATAALFSSYLHFVRDLVQTARASVRDVQHSLGAFLWPVVNVFFVVWIASLVLGFVAGGTSSGVALLYAVWLVALVALNAVPEVLYLRGTHGGMQTIAASWEFLQAQWIPWFAVNVPLLAAVGLVVLVVQVPIVGSLLAGAAVHVAMVFRGYLFRALDRSSHRQRMFSQRVA